MTWHDLLFAHWPLPVEALRPLVPPALEIDTWKGEAWIGVVAFRMSGVRARCLPALPGISAFPEINVRTYVTDGARAGVWFSSLDASCLIALSAARWTYHLPYFHARMSCLERQGWVHYESARRAPAVARARFRARCRPLGDVYHTAAGSLEHWLTERYCMYAIDRGGQLLCSDIHHRPWNLQAAEAHIEVNAMTDVLGVELPDRPPRLHFSRRIDTVAWRMRSWRPPLAPERRSAAGALLQRRAGTYRQDRDDPTMR